MKNGNQGVNEAVPAPKAAAVCAKGGAGAFNVFRFFGLWGLVGCYVLFVVFAMHMLGESTQTLYDYPYAVSREAREMKSRLYGMKGMLPTVFATPGLSFSDIERILVEQENIQDESLKKLGERYRGNSDALHALRQSMLHLREARRTAAWATRRNSEFHAVNDLYNREVLPYFEKVEMELDELSAAADKRGKIILARMNKIRIWCSIVTVIMALFISWIIGRTFNLEQSKNKEIRFREKLSNLLTANIDEVFFIFHSNTKSDGFEYVSSNSERILGIPAESFSKDRNALYSLLAPDEVDWLKTILIERTLRSPVERELVLKGSERRFRICVYPICQNDTLERFILAFSDRTEALAYQQNLRDALENARSANAAKSQFLSHMSHEIRTPMNAIIGMTTIALSKQDDRARVEDCLTKIAQSSRHLLGLINDVLDMSKIEGGKLSIAHEPFNFRQSVQSIVNLIQPQTQTRGQKFDVRMFNVVEEELCGDALRLNQILLNILSNSLKFTPKGGAITLEIHELPKKNNNVRFRFIIRDTGIGMSKEFLKRLYQPFEQAQSSTASKFSGTGLGMSITKNLVTLLGGSISVKSEEGKGSEFTVELPFGLSGRQPSERVGLESLKVLVVDDDRGACEHAVLLLDKMGLRTRWVLSGDEAVKIVVEAHQNGDDYDVCFIDWQMPGLDGVETVRRIRQELGPDILVIIISAYDWSAIEHDARAAGVNAFVAKPFFASSLYNTLLSSTKNKQAKNEACASNPSRQKYDFSGKRILLVEDNEFNREVAQEFIEMTGAVVECAENGKQGVEMFTNSTPGYYSLILMDVQMPVMDGYEATGAIRESAHKDAESIHILAMTANAFSEDIAAAVAAGMNGHIAKPLDVAALYRLMEAHIYPEQSDHSGQPAQ